MKYPHYTSNGIKWYQWSGVIRSPRQGEYYLSGAIPEVYRASSNLSYPFRIMVECEVPAQQIVHDGMLYRLSGPYRGG